MTATQSQKLARRLCALAPIYWGIDLLKEDIEKQSTVFCICSVARDYHVGAKDSEEIFRRAIERDRLYTKGGAPDSPETLFIPKHPPLTINGDLEESEARVAADLARAYEILETAFPTYKRGRHLAEQEGRIQDSFRSAFRNLQISGFLPITTGNAAFNHQGIVLLMEQCFPSRQTFVAYLRDPCALA
jgi:hypothetical protein